MCVCVFFLRRALVSLSLFAVLALRSLAHSHARARTRVQAKTTVRYDYPAMTKVRAAGREAGASVGGRARERL